MVGQPRPAGERRRCSFSTPTFFFSTISLSIFFFSINLNSFKIFPEIANLTPLPFFFPFPVHPSTFSGAWNCKNNNDTGDDPPDGAIWQLFRLMVVQNFFFQNWFELAKPKMEMEHFILLRIKSEVMVHSTRKNLKLMKLSRQNTLNSTPAAYCGALAQMKGKSQPLLASSCAGVLHYPRTSL